ncbi:unnamed protein product [Periconia digitata]|uniref:Zn(2)-C6 fungal-type domain-containing protein n=1 Tax=Periconia digitata TaxID=1303443 RepID=A0A9W4U7L0_9PLEO|nr:unnamed protein product [Periconia digitata]
MANSYRPLQPAPMEEQPTPPPSQPRAPLVQKPKRTVTLGACLACRKRKSKCDGSRPVCTCCVQKETACVYELGPNEKPSQAMKRKNEEMQGELFNLRQLYDFLRLRPEQEALDILRKIRSEPPESSTAQRIQELADLTRKQGELLGQLPSSLGSSLVQQSEQVTLPPIRLALGSPNSDPDNLSFPNIFPLVVEGPSSQRRRHALDVDVSASSDSQSSLPAFASLGTALHTRALDQSPDPRLDSIKSWTSVTKDNHLLSLLFSSWHTWEYSYFHFFDWDIFLDDLSCGKSDFCSELLVNAVLATACFHLPLIKDRSKPFGDNILTEFYREARRLWELDEGNNSLTRIQSALCIFMVLGKHGRDKVGSMFLNEACRIARDMGLFRVSLPSPEKPVDKRWERSRAVTAWSLFNFQLEMSFTYSFPPLITEQPPIAVPYEEIPEKEAFFRYRCTRHILILECSKILTESDAFVSEVPPKPEVIEVLYVKMKSCYDAQPSILDPEKFPSPPNLLAALQHHASIVRLFQPFITRSSSAERMKAYRDHAISVTRSTIKEIRRLLALHDVHHGWEKTITFILDSLVIASFGTLEEVALENNFQVPPEGNEPYEGLLTCLRAIGIVATYVFYAQPLFRLLTQSCEKLGIPLPIELISALDCYTSEEWTRNAAGMVSSQYIADLRKTANDVENARMDAIVSQWKDMSLEEKTAATQYTSPPSDH